MSMRYPGGFIASTPVTAAYPSGVWTQAQAIPYQAQNVWTRDQYWPYTTLLLQGNGTNGAQNNTFLDSSSNNFTITRNGNTTQGSFTPYEANGYWGAYIDNSSSYVSYGSSADFTFGTGDFTVEAWVFVSSIAASNVFTVFNVGSNSNGSYAVYIYPNGTIQSVRYGDTASAGTTTTAITLNAWNHIAAVRSGGTARVYINGIADAASAYAMGNVTATAGETGRVWQIAQTAAGYVSNLRVCKGTAVYASNFTPSTSPLTSTSQSATNCVLLALQGNRFIDANTTTTAKTVTPSGTPSVQAFQPFPGATTYSGTVLGGSGYFDGSGDYLTAPSNAVFDFGTGDFTIEAWGYRTSSGAYGFLISRRAADFNFGPFSLGVDGSNVPYFACSSSGSSWIFVLTGSALPLNTWFHLAGVRNGNTFALYVNGVSVGTASSSASLMASSVAACIGAHANGSEPFAGYIANPRIVKGTAVYTANFTVPTAPLTAVSGTSLLLPMTNAGIFDAAAMNDLETVGNAQVSTSVVKYGTGSMAFDGNGDWLMTPRTVNLTFPASSAFTFECWVYLNSTPSSYQMLMSDSNVGASKYITINGARLDAQFGGTSGTTANAAFPFVGNTWYHIAVVRDASNVVSMYVNGASLSVTNPTQSNAMFDQGSVIYIGRFGDNANPYALNGYIDDLRITKSARYLTSFTPPPARLPAQ